MGAQLGQRPPEAAPSLSEESRVPGPSRAASLQVSHRPLPGSTLPRRAGVQPLSRAAWLSLGEGLPEIRGPQDFRTFSAGGARSPDTEPKVSFPCTDETLRLPSGQSGPRGLFTQPCPAPAARPPTQTAHLRWAPPCIISLRLHHGPGRGSVQPHLQTRDSSLQVFAHGHTAVRASPVQTPGQASSARPSRQPTALRSAPSCALARVWL